MTDIECRLVSNRLDELVFDLGEGEVIPSPIAVLDDKELDEEVEAVNVDVKDEKRLAAPEALPIEWLGDMLLEEGEAVEADISL